MNTELARHHMIQQQLRTCEVLTPDVVDRLYADRREQYVPVAYRNLAFADIGIPLGQGENAAAMLTPKLEARLLQTAQIQPTDRVLEIGTGSGHMAALLAEQAEAVWSMEIDPLLAEQAQARLTNDGVSNVTVVCGDGLAGLPEAVTRHAPFDFILVSGGVQEIPAALLAQLKTGGRLLAFVGRSPVMVLRQVTRIDEQSYATEDLLETDVPCLRGGEAAPRFAF
jgi:protein-L-isoaspartate(D-aspartate) O-methyltransferase